MLVFCTLNTHTIILLKCEVQIYNFGEKYMYVWFFFSHILLDYPTEIKKKLELIISILNWRTFIWNIFIIQLLKLNFPVCVFVGARPKAKGLCSTQMGILNAFGKTKEWPFVIK